MLSRRLAIFTLVVASATGLAVVAIGGAMRSSSEPSMGHSGVSGIVLSDTTPVVVSVLDPAPSAPVLSDTTAVSSTATPPTSTVVPAPKVTTAEPSKTLPPAASTSPSLAPTPTAVDDPSKAPVQTAAPVSKVALPTVGNPPDMVTDLGLVDQETGDPTHQWVMNGTDPAAGEVWLSNALVAAGWVLQPDGSYAKGSHAIQVVAQPYAPGTFEGKYNLTMLLLG